MEVSQNIPQMSITIRGTEGTIYKVADGLTVLAVKEHICTLDSSLLPTELNILYKGRELSDSCVLTRKLYKRLLYTLTPEAVARIKEERRVQDECLAEDCHFFGAYVTQGYCSACFKIQKDREKDERKDMEREQDEDNASTGLVDSTITSALADDQDPTHCWKCNKSISLLGYRCKCRHVFCSKHRHAYNHACTFDFKTYDRAQLRKLATSPVKKK